MSTKYVSVDGLSEFLTKLKQAYAANSSSAFQVNYAASAGTATSATNDADGHPITNYLYDDGGAIATKIAGIETGAEVNVIESIEIDGQSQAIASKVCTLDLSAYAKKTDIAAALNFKGNATGAQLAAAVLSADGDKLVVANGDVYSCSADSGTFHAGYEYAAVVSGTPATLTWVELGKYLDLSGYATKFTGTFNADDIAALDSSGNLKTSGVSMSKLSGANIASPTGSFTTDTQVKAAIDGLGDIVNDVQLQVGSGTAATCVSNGTATIQIADAVATGDTKPVTSGAVYSAISGLSTVYSKVEDHSGNQITTLVEASNSDIDAIFGV